MLRGLQYMTSAKFFVRIICTFLSVNLGYFYDYTRSTSRSQIMIYFLECFTMSRMASNESARNLSNHFVRQSSPVSSTHHFMAVWCSVETLAVISQKSLCLRSAFLRSRSWSSKSFCLARFRDVSISTRSLFHVLLTTRQGRTWMIGSPRIGISSRGHGAHFLWTVCQKHKGPKFLLYPCCLN